MVEPEEKLLEELKRNDWNPRRVIFVSLNGMDVLLLHGVISLALKHPQLPEYTKARALEIKAALEKILVDQGALTGAQLERIHELGD